MVKLSAAILLWLLTAASARPEWKVRSSDREPSRQAGLERQHVVLEDSETGDHATLEFALFLTKSFTLRVIDQPNEPRVNLADVMKRENCLAGVNGGYFDPDYAPVGLLVSDGRLIAPLRKARLLSGVMSVGNGRVRIMRPAEFSLKSRPIAARQCGPFLVDRAKPISGLNDTRSARRTFAAISGAERALLGYASHVTLAQLGALLATPGVAGQMKISRAVNLDGGSSSAFWFSGDGKPFSIPEQKTVRDFVAIVPK